MAAVKAAGLRVPDSATPAQRELADRALQRIAAVMEENVNPMAASFVLKASTVLREEVCGQMKQRVEHSFDGMTDEQLEARFKSLVTAAGQEGAPQEPSGVDQEAEPEREP